jgi:CBS domain containing-hemolysin-like protein
LLAILALVLLNGFFVAAEFALVRSRRTRLEAMVRSGDRLARIALRASSNISRVLSASQLGVTLASLGLGWIAESTLAKIFEGLFDSLPFAMQLSLRVTLAGIVAYTVLTYLHVVLGELTPKAAALNSPEKFAKFLAPPLMLFAWLMSPFIWILHKSANRLLKMMGQPGAGAVEAVHSPEELRLLVEQAQEGGAIQSSDADLIDAVFEFSEKNAREVMTPRTEIVSFDVVAPLEDVLRIVEESQFSRYPVYEESIDNIIGLVLTKDLLRLLIPGAASDSSKSAAEFDVRKLIRPVHVIPGSREVEDVLADFKRLKEHMAIVLDEYGGTAGIITMEDLIEEVIGDISDEYDFAARTAIEADGVLELDGTMSLIDVRSDHRVQIPEGDWTTLGGYAFAKLGRLPRMGDRVPVPGGELEVIAMDGRRIAALRVHRASPTPPQQQSPRK